MTELGFESDSLFSGLFGAGRVAELLSDRGHLTEVVRQLSSGLKQVAVEINAAAAYRQRFFKVRSCLLRITTLALEVSHTVEAHHEIAKRLRTLTVRRQQTTTKLQALTVAATSRGQIPRLARHVTQLL